MLVEDDRVVRCGLLVGGAIEVDWRGFDVEALLPLRLGRVAVGCVGPLANGSGCDMLEGSRGSSTNAFDIVEAVDATDAECARRAVSSRVSLLTIASCSFSNSRCSSAAVIGLGCLIGGTELGSAVPEVEREGNGCILLRRDPG